MAKVRALLIKTVNLWLATMTVMAAVSSGMAALSTSSGALNKPVSQEVLVAREKRRLEELFIWKMSEELKLPVETETSFAEAIRSLNREKAKANLDVAEALIAIDKAQNGDRAKSKVATAKAVSRYEKAWRAYGALPIREVARMRTILGNERLGRYLVAKSQMAEKLKALSAHEAVDAAPQVAPLVAPESKSK